MDLNEILAVGFKGGASDIHLKAGLPPMFRINGALLALKGVEPLVPDAIRQMAFALLNERQKKALEDTREADVAHGIAGVGRFRINVYHQRGTLCMAIRVIPMNVPDFDGLRLPPIIKKIADLRRGLVLVTGTTSSGKSSTLAAMINHINSTRTCHIITIEDPIEFLIRDKRSMVNQREVGMDTLTFGGALKSALRQDPDVILIGEMRDHETIETALHAAETGHLVLSTLHTLDAAETINRIVSGIPANQQAFMRHQLASILKAVISQRLVPCADQKSRVPAVEVLIATKRAQELIADEKRISELRETIAEGYKSYGMQTFDQSLMFLLNRNLVTYEEAIRQASNPDDFALRYKGIQSTSDGRWEDFEGEKKKEKQEDTFEVERF
ncbi:MAG: type IV pilus twitching motility protein PilT [Myxococcales bacterium]|nr:MAG: type IV pilus twitching motility protein PilT [Myxococcales bacterium]